MAQGYALVTGAGIRIGKGIAIDLATAGYKVALHCNSSTSAAAENLAAIKAAGGDGVIVKADLSDENATAALMTMAQDALGAPVDVLVNNASVFEYDNAMSVDADSWHQHMQIHMRAPMILAQAMAKALPESRPGNIINIIDQRVWKLTPHFTSYTVSKAGLWTLTQTLAQSFAKRDIRVNAIGPGPVLPSLRQTDEDFAKQCAAMPLGRGTSVEEICRTVRFLLEAPAITGQMIALDGGQHLEWRLQDAINIKE